MMLNNDSPLGNVRPCFTGTGEGAPWLDFSRSSTGWGLRKRSWQRPPNESCRTRMRQPAPRRRPFSRISRNPEGFRQFAGASAKYVRGMEMRWQGRISSAPMAGAINPETCLYYSKKTPERLSTIVRGFFSFRRPSSGRASRAAPLQLLPCSPLLSGKASG